MTVRPLVLITASTLLSLFAGASQAYDLSRAEYEAMGQELPAWDHDGRLPQGDGRLYELQQIHQQIEERAQRLQVSGFLLKQMEAQTTSPDKYRSMRADYATQLQSFARWRESTERRRQAILLSAGLSAADHPKETQLQVSSNP
jgi:hypothetical protein